MSYTSVRAWLRDAETLGAVIQATPGKWPDVYDTWSAVVNEKVIGVFNCPASGWLDTAVAS